MNKQTKAANMLRLAKDLIDTIKGIVAKHQAKPLKLSASMLYSLCKTINRAHGLIERAAALEEIYDYEQEEDQGPTSFLVLQDLLQAWKDLEALVNVIAESLRSDPSKTKASQLNALSSCAGLSVKFADVAEHVEKEKQRIAEMEVGNGCTKDELELLEAYAELEKDIGEIQYQNINHNTSPTPTQGALNQPLETEEDYRFGMSPRNLWNNDDKEF